MATKTKKPAAARKAKGSDLGRLSQSEAASLIGKPAVWLRDNAHLFQRNDDGTYDGRQAVKAVQTKFRSADLSNSEIEPVMQFCDDVANFAIGNLGCALRLIEGIEQSHGAAGLAAITEQLLDTLREELQLYGEPETESAANIQQAADAKIGRLEYVAASHQYRKVVACECGKFRSGRSWKTGPAPSGAAVCVTVCPACEKRSRRKGSK